MVIAENERTNSPEMHQQTTFTMTIKSADRKKGINKIAAGAMNTGNWRKLSTRRDSMPQAAKVQSKVSQQRSKTNYYRIPAPNPTNVGEALRAIQSRNVVQI